MANKDALLQSKIQIPSPSRNFIVRERLVQLLAASESRLIVISASMGYGKTVLMTHFAHRYAGSSAWYHLSETDNDIMVFCRYLSKSLARLNPSFSFDFSAYHRGELSTMLVQNLALDMCAALAVDDSQPLYIVLDDFQVIHNSYIFQFISTILESGPPHVHIYLNTKAAPPAFSARHMLSGAAQLVGSSVLSFTPEEVRLLLESQVPGQILDTVVDSLHTRMEGWPAGICFAALYFRQRQSNVSEEAIEQTCRQHFLQDYFMHELYRKLPYDLQQFLTKTAVLDVLRPDICNVLTGEDNSASQLAYLDRENLFILRVSEGEQIYRYHAMFRGFLRGLLQPLQHLELLDKAANFYLATDEKAQAVEYAIACHNANILARAIQIIGPKVLAQGQKETLQRWLDALIASRVPLTGELRLLQAKFYHSTGRWQDALSMTQSLVEELESSQQLSRLWAESKVFYASLLRAHVSHADCLHALTALIADSSYLLPHSPELYATLCQLHVYSLVDLGQHRQALAVAQGLLDDPEIGGQPWHFELMILCHFMLGDYRQALKTYVILRSSHEVKASGKLITLYMAMSGQLSQAVERYQQEASPLTDFDGIYPTAMTHLIQLLSSNLEALEQGNSPSYSPFPTPIQPANQFAPFRQVMALLSASITQEHVPSDVEETLFRLDIPTLPMMQDSTRWFLIRKHVHAGRHDQALELCRQVRKLRAESLPMFQQQASITAFVAFVLLQEALLVAHTDPDLARQLTARCAPYLRTHGLKPPGLSPRERDQLSELLSEWSEDSSDPLLASETQHQPKAEAELDPQSHVLTVECFGTFLVLMPDKTPLKWRTKKARELFAYLFHLQGAKVSRDRVMDVLWPNSSPRSATSLLHTTLYGLRKALTPFGLEGLITYEAGEYHMNMSLIRSPRPLVDEICQGTLPTVEASQLPTLYQAPYLEDVDALWCTDSRMAYTSAIIRVCRTLSIALMEQGDFRRAVDCLRLAISQEPYDEDLTAQLIRCYTALGETKNAMTQFARLKEVLSDDLDAQPGTHVCQVYKDCLRRRIENRRMA